MKEFLLATRGVFARCHRIPALAVINDSKLVAVWDARPDVDDLPAPVSLALATSADCGETWSEPKIFRQSHQEMIGETQVSVGYGDASLLADRANGKLLCFCAASYGGGFFDPIQLDPPAGLHIELGISEDDGETWRFNDLTSQVLDGYDAGFASSGNGIQLSGGKYDRRLLQPLVVRKTVATGDGRSETKIAVVVIFSDDGGETWQRSNPIGLAAGQLAPNETKLVQSSLGEVLLCSRAAPNRLLARSFDGGVSFTDLQPHTQLPDPSDNGGLATWGEYLVCTHNRSRDSRANLVAAISADSGNSWSKIIPIYPGSAGYSVAQELPDGDLGVLYEKSGYTQLVFAKITSRDLAGAIAETAAPTTGELLQIIPTMTIDKRQLAVEQTGLVQGCGEDSAVQPSESDGLSGVQLNVQPETASRHFGALATGDPAGPIRPELKAGDLIAANICYAPDWLSAEDGSGFGQVDLQQLRCVGDFSAVKTGQAGEPLPDGAPVLGNDCLIWPDLVHQITQSELDGATGGEIVLRATVVNAAEPSVVLASAKITIDLASGLAQPSCLD